MEVLKKCLEMTEEQRNTLIDTGLFNCIIEGYLVATLREMEKGQEEIETAQRTLKIIFDEMTSAEVMKEV